MNTQTPAAQAISLRLQASACTITDQALIEMSASDRADLVHRVEKIATDAAILPHRIWVARRWAPRFLAVCSLFLVPWIGYLIVTLPQRYETRNWSLAWSGLDVAELVALAITAWSLWKQRQIAVSATLVTAVLLVCDAWFDVTTAQPGLGLLESVASALFAEMPLAACLLALHVRLDRVSTRLKSGQSLQARLDPSWRLALPTAGIIEHSGPDE
jgi:hypothetical protein